MNDIGDPLHRQTRACVTIVFPGDPGSAHHVVGTYKIVSLFGELGRSRVPGGSLTSGE